MPKSVSGDPWPRLRDVVAAAMAGLQDGRFIEETLESLCVQLGAASAWSTLEIQGGGPLHRSRSTSFQGAPPAVLAMHVTGVLGKVQTGLKPVFGSLEYAPESSFIAVPLWSRPTGSSKGRSLVGAMYLEFGGDEGTHPANIEFVESVGTLLGGMIAQQSLIEASKEDLRVERAVDHKEREIGLDEMLAPASMHEIGEELRNALHGDASIVLFGESGTGKTQLATAFARASRREPIVRATLGMADDLNTITSELFGHERGAFSGAVSKRKGLVEYADGGTLILDEVLNLPPHAQQLLLDFTQFGWYRPLGYQARDPKAATVRLISVTNGDIAKAVAEGRFRKDLYYRLAIMPLTMPPLRTRRWDVPQIAVRYLNRTDIQADWELDGDAVEMLTSPRLGWPGNIRELEAVMERARNRARAAGSESKIQGSHLDLAAKSTRPPLLSYEDAKAPSAPSSDDNGNHGIREKWRELGRRRDEVESLEKEAINEALEACAGTVARAARLLELPRTGSISRMAKLGIDPDGFKPQLP